MVQKGSKIDKKQLFLIKIKKGGFYLNRPFSNNIFIFFKPFSFSDFHLLRLKILPYKDNAQHG